MPFKRGQSGNPGGRPKALSEVRDLARQQTPQAIKTLAEIATVGHNESARVAAAKELLDRGWGKAPQPVEGQIEHVHKPAHDLSQLSTQDLRELARIMEQLQPKTKIIDVTPLAPPVPDPVDQPD